MKYCQGTKCHEYRTKDRIRGTKGAKYYSTRRRSDFYYGRGNFCSLNCQNDWLNEYADRAIDHFGRTTEAYRTDCSSAWYKDYTWGTNNNHRHFLINDLLGERIPITEQQYSDDSFTKPN
tara:strand:+ start:77 stop:436 length:360 start_codon:yes stop_codon:yes gene_type:complete